MSRKTRKLMWSVSLIAAVAVIGALAAFVVLQPNGAAAHDEGPGVAAHQPPPPVTGIDVFTPTIANGGRSSLQVSWNAPVTTGANTATMYRVDISTDTDVWHNVIGGEESDKGTLTESMAMSNCTTDDDGDRCYTATGLTADTQYHFRVFAMNEFGTSPISEMETIASGTTLRIDPPAKATGLDATDYYEDQIVVSWDAVTDTGGADVLWYCVGVASSPSGAFTDLTDADNVAACMDAMEADDVDNAGNVDLLGLDDQEYASQTAIIAATDENGDAVTSWTHDGLGGGDTDDDDQTDEFPHEIELRYRLYAVTDQDGDATSTGARKIARAASEVATGRTVRPVDVPDPQVASPGRVGNLKAVAYSTGGIEDHDSNTATPEILVAPSATTQHLHFFWNHPDGYLADADGDGAGTDPNWRVEVQRRVPRAEDHPMYTDWQFVTGEAVAAATTGYGVPQFDVDFDDEDTVLTATPPTYAEPVLWGDNQSGRSYRVRYVNMAGTPTDTDDDVEGPWAGITIPQVTTDYVLATGDLADNFTGTPTTTLPIVRISANDSNVDTTPGLRFEHLEGRNGRDHIKLVWDRNMNARTPTNQPNGYVIDRSADGGDTWHRLARADSPRDLGATDTFTDSHEVVPGATYLYRVFPVFINTGPDAYGAPALVNAASRGADRPTAVRNLRVTADGQHALDLEWDQPADDGGHDVEGYLIQVTDDDGNGNPVEADWALVPAEEDVEAPLTVEGKDTTTYKYNPMDGTPLAPVLTPGSTRWFRVIPITDENDGSQDTGGTTVNIETGAVLTTGVDTDDLNNTADLPHEDDATRATPKDGTTEGLGDAEADRMITPPAAPVDLTAEAASDSNALGDGDRGVFLTWNQVEDPDTATASYRINRIRMNTGVDALNSKDGDDADSDIDWLYLERVEDVTSWTDPTPLRQDEETRMYQVCSEATGVADPVCVYMAVDYELHPPMHDAVPPELTAPTNVMATSDTDGEVTVMWMGSDNADRYIIIALERGSSPLVIEYVLAESDASEATITGLNSDASHLVIVLALKGTGADREIEYGTDTVTVQ